MAFATPAEMQQRFDTRAIGDLLLDDGTTASAAAQLTNENLQTALDDAAGEIVAACVSNQHYTTAQLVELAALGSSYPSASLLKRLNCALAIPHLFGRRLYNEDEVQKRIPDIQWARDMVEMIKNGQRVFELPITNVQAGVMRTQALGSSLCQQGTTLVGHNHRAFGNTPVNSNDCGCQ